MERKLSWDVHLPLSFSELTREDLVFIGQNWSFKNDLAFQTKFLFHRCHFKKRPLFGIIARLFLKYESDLILAKLSNNGKPTDEWPLSWLSNDPNSEKTTIDHLELNGKVYQTFSDGLRNISINEFAEAEKYLEMIIRGSMDPIENLVSVLFKPEYEIFDILSAHARAMEFVAIPMELKIAISLQYRAQRNFMISCNKAAFEKTGKSTGPKNTWKDIVQDLSGEFVNVQEVGVRPAWEVFSWISHSTKRAQELKSIMSKKK